METPFSHVTAKRYVDFSADERLKFFDRLVGKHHGAINLDGLSKDDLWLVWQVTRHDPARLSRRMFPEKSSRGTRTVMHSLGNYAANRATALACRERGSIQAALGYEAICERIYDKLPLWARW